LPHSPIANGSAAQLLDLLKDRQPRLWLPPFPDLGGSASEKNTQTQDITFRDVTDAAAFLQDWSGALMTLFPELKASSGLIESPLIAFSEAEALYGMAVSGRHYIKADHLLPVAGSIKARGGVFEVLKFAQGLACRAGLFRAGNDPALLLLPKVRALFAQHTIGVGSTGNLGLSIGVMASALGFRSVVHMSHDAKAWKKKRLTDHGVVVVEHRGDYAAAVDAGRRELEQDPLGYFVDDEHSVALLLGYAVAALRLKGQLDHAGVAVDQDHPLIVYLPCGVGGAPGGITFGLKHLFGDSVHCLWAEPAASPAMFVRLLSDRPQSVYAVGLDNRTEADGLAVAQASELVYGLVRNLIGGVYTVLDDDLFRIVHRLAHETGLMVEPSAAAGFLGLPLLKSAGVRRLIKVDPAAATHIYWTTGGSFVPMEEQQRFLDKGRELNASVNPDTSVLAAGP